MNLYRLHRILAETTVQLRKGDMIVNHKTDTVNVTEIFAMPHVDDPLAADLDKVDLEFLVIGVHKAIAENRRAELIEILQRYPDPARFAAGLSYIEVGAVIGDQGAAFQLFALGKVLGLWDVITPRRLGLTGEEAHAAAGKGFIMTTGWRTMPPEPPP